MTTSARGRPRDPVRHRAVLNATVDVLIEQSYDALTFTEVAARAGVGRPLIYQWWGSKAALVQDALFRPRSQASADPLRTADFATTLAALIAEMVELHSRPEFRMGLPGLIVDMIADPTLQDAADQRFIAPARARYNAVFEEGKRAGAVREDLDGASVLDTLRGAVMFHTLLNPTVDPAQLTSQLTDLVLHGVSPTHDVATYEQEPAP